MSTIRQLVSRNKREIKVSNSRVKGLLKCPQRRGVVQRVFIQSPKKPNSAKRKVANVRLTTRRIVRCHIPGEGHNLTKHSVVLVRGGRCQDLIGVRYKPIRGVFDFLPLRSRRTRLSKYGIKTKN